jgi:hypothetical protein
MSQLRFTAHHRGREVLIAKTLELAGSGLAIMGAVLTGYGLVRIMDRVTDRIEKLRNALQAIVADAKFGFTGKTETHSVGAEVIVEPQVKPRMIKGLPLDADAEVLRAAILEDRDEVAKVREDMRTLGEEARADAAEMVKAGVAELESKLNLIERDDLWPAALGIVITIAGGAVGWYGIFLS